MTAIKQIQVPNTYEAYLQTEQFDKIRQAVFYRDNFQCVICGSIKMLQAHHLTYRNIYHEPTGDLITLCRTCHSIYHAIDKRREAINAIYRREDSLHAVENALPDYKAITRISETIAEEIKEEYLPKDYCKDGDLDMCAWEVLNRVIDAKCKQHGINYYSGNKNELRSYFTYRRCEFLLKCMDANISFSRMIAETKFDAQWLAKWYKRSRCEAKLNEEKELYEEDNK